MTGTAAWYRKRKVYITEADDRAENCYWYDAFGSLLEKREGMSNRILYTGQQYDQATGQYYLRARYYNPVVGRFLQEDTYRGDGLNLYAYCAGNPVGYYDPSGHAGEECPLETATKPADTQGSQVDIGNGSEIETLYHYTNEKGMNGIIESQQLNPSLKANNPKDARYGDGQYLSDLRPENQTPVELARKFINVPNKYKYTHYVEIDVTDFGVIQGRENIFVIPGNNPLNLTDRIVSIGIVGE